MEINSLLNLPLPELLGLANKTRKEHLGSKLELCSIINAKSGYCDQDCKFCAQSSRHSADISIYQLKEKSEILDAAKQAQNIGAKKFGIVTSGNRLNNKELDVIVQAVSEIKSQLRIDICASLGALEKSELAALKEAGLCRYHHNIET